MRDKQFRAVTLAAGLVAWSGLVAPRCPPRLLVPMHAVLSAALVLRSGAQLGLRPPQLSRGLKYGSASAAVVAAAVASTTSLPRVRTAMEARTLPPSARRWLLVRIPIGTVWSEEAAYRGALGTVAEAAFGPRWGRLLQAITFGLSHVADARAAHESVAGTVVATAAAGWGFGWLYAQSGSLVAPMLAHLASNEAGAVAALLVQRRGR